jgi:hypothetical protein
LGGNFRLKSSHTQLRDFFKKLNKACMARVSKIDQKSGRCDKGKKLHEGTMGTRSDIFVFSLGDAFMLKLHLNYVH